MSPHDIHMNSRKLDEARYLEAISRSPVVGPGIAFDVAVCFNHYRQLVLGDWQPFIDNDDFSYNSEELCSECGELYGYSATYFDDGRVLCETCEGAHA